MRPLALAFLLLLAGTPTTVVVAQSPTVARPPAATDTTPRDSLRDSAAARRAPPRRRPMTPALERSAFADPRARDLLARARAARIAQDSALLGYDAKTFQRLSATASIRRTGIERLLLRTEQAAHVRWSRGSGLWVEPTGRRTAFPMGSAQLDLVEATPIPYFPGRESLWIPASEMGVAKAEVDENEFLHPLATGAEAYYRYATGDSISIRLPTGRTVGLRELRITARRPEWRAFVGSFWFDVERGSLVRAAYRLAADVDLWQSANEEQRRKIEELEARARTDTGAAAERARREAERERGSTLDAALLKMAQNTFSPMRAALSAVTVEYGLYEGRFWLPKRNVAEGSVQAGFVRTRVKFEESFRYASVNGADSVPRVGTPAELGLAADDTAWFGGGNINIGGSIGGGGGRPRPADTSAAARTAREDSLVRYHTVRADSLRGEAEKARARGDTALARRLTTRADRNVSLARRITRRREACARGDSSYVAGTTSRYDGALRMAIRMPCDTTRLANSPDLPGSIYEPNEAVFGSADAEELVKSLDFGLQPQWGPQRPTFHTGLDLLRYNRIEGLSLGGSATSALGLGLTARAVARVGTGDWVPNGELSLSRSNGRSDVRLGVFHRLGVANDDWGAPLSFGASLANLLYARDEGFYYRTWGAELAGSRDAPGPLAGATLLWRAFAERQRSAGTDPNTQANLAGAFGGTHFLRNIDAAELTAFGVGAELGRTFGIDPTKARLDARLRGETALTDAADSLTGTSGYGRLAAEGTLSRGLGGRFTMSLTGAVGGAAGELPPQRAFYVGGLQTVRGQFARPQGAGRVGDAFWLGRAELGLGRIVAARPTLFYDVGWAGPRADVAHPGQPLSGAGAGLSLLDGMVRIDVARGIRPEQRWRLDFSLGARF